MRALCGAILAAGLSLSVSLPVLATGGPVPVPSAKTAPLSAAQKSQAEKTLAAAVSVRQTQYGKLPAPKNAVQRFQAHRCVVIHDETVGGKERAANGPFRTSCSDWVLRKTKDQAVRDADRPCTARDYGPDLAGCASWVVGWDAGAGKWAEVWRRPGP